MCGISSEKWQCNLSKVSNLLFDNECIMKEVFYKMLSVTRIDLFLWNYNQDKIRIVEIIASYFEWLEF